MKCLEKFDKFIELGGYRDVISEYIIANYLSALNAPKKILENYKCNISKSTDDKLPLRIQKIYKEIGVMLFVDNQNFRLTQVDKGGHRCLEHSIH